MDDRGAAITGRLSRRGLLAGAPAALAAPAVQAPPARVLKFIPQADLEVLDPIATTACVTRNHGYLVFDTLFGQDAQFRPTLQMLDSAGTDNDGKLWRLTLRPGLLFHDGTRVLARDCVASLRRWMACDPFGGALLEATDDISAADDRTILVRLRRPFPLLPDALGKITAPMPAMMPERLARTDPSTPVTEMVGSGPYRFLPRERIAGARVAYERFALYRPREDGKTEWTAGPKIARFDRIDWVVIADDATAAAALETGEVDWWENPTADLAPVLAANPRLVVRVADPTGAICLMRLNHLQPPFDDPGVRRALLGVVDQTAFMRAAAGANPAMWRAGVGLFCPGTPMASEAGMEVLTSPRDLLRGRRALRDAGYDGERTVVLAATDAPWQRALAETAADTMRMIGINVDVLAADQGGIIRRRENKGPVEEGGWSVFFAVLPGLDLATPAGPALRATGETAWFGWPSSQRLEALRQDWLAAPELESRQRICADMQRQAWIDVPQIPLGQWFQPTAYRADLTGVLDGFCLFWNLRRG